MNRKFFRKIAVAVVACVMVLSVNLVAFAATCYDDSVGYAGATRVKVEVGFSGKSAYAKVTASDYVDGSMEGTVYCKSDKGIIQKSFSQRTYDEFSASYSSDVEVISCDFNIVGNDGGTWNQYLCAYLNSNT